MTDSIWHDNSVIPNSHQEIIFTTPTGYQRVGIYIPGKGIVDVAGNTRTLGSIRSWASWINYLQAQHYNTIERLEYKLLQNDCERYKKALDVAVDMLRDIQGTHDDDVGVILQEIDKILNQGSK